MLEKMNTFGAEKKPFIFIIDYAIKKIVVIPFEEAENSRVYFDINGIKNYTEPGLSPKRIEMEKNPVSFDTYKKSFDIVQSHLELGDSYLVNLTFPTEIKINMALKGIFYRSAARYKLFYKDLFTVFSPETFVKIRNGIIYSYPMKGTINAGIYAAEQILLNDEKEIAEHITIVDLIRNDLNMVARNIRVTRFRYIEKIKTNYCNLLQVSSEICGELDRDYHKKIGDIICRLLPAGSITGAPKKSTINIIEKAEIYDRGFYTGIFGYFDGMNLDSAVMIRFIEKNKEKYIFKSGGGITIYSDPMAEYREMIDKVYAQIN